MKVIFLKGNNCIVICYVDDCCIFYKGKEKIDALLKNLSNKFKLTYEGDVKSYLEKNVSKHPNGTITKIQPAIINKTLKILGICDESKMHDISAHVILKKDEDGNGRKKEYK